MKKILILNAFLAFCVATQAQSFKTVKKRIEKRIEKINRKIEDTWVGTIYFYDDTELTCQFTLNTLNAEGVLLVKTDTTTHLFAFWCQRCEVFFFL